MKQYIKNGEVKPQSGIIIKKNGKQILNPSEALILAEGWIQYNPENTIEISIEEQRRLAYQQECDKYLIAYQGYLLEGNIEKAEEQKQLYLEKKNKIRQIFCENKKIIIESEVSLNNQINYIPPMEIFKGQYYMQDDIVYECIRSSEKQLDNNLCDLIGLYVYKV